MTSPADPSALLAPLDALAAAATAGPWEVAEDWYDGPLQGIKQCGSADWFIETPTKPDAAFIVALVNSYPVLAAAIRDGEARVEAWEAKCAEVGLPPDPEMLVRHHRANAALAASLNAHAAEAERDAAIARADAAEKVCRSIYGDGTWYDRAALDAWREVAP